VLLTLTSTAHDADDLGYLLHKHPDRVQQRVLSVVGVLIFIDQEV